MFMLMLNAGSDQVVARQIKAPLNVRSLRSKPMRSQELWMEKMNAATVGFKARYYAFKYRGWWHLCDAYNHHTPIRSMRDGEGVKDAAEMWIMARERADG